jgi:hypothetical protein
MAAARPTRPPRDRADGGTRTRAQEAGANPTARERQGRDKKEFQNQHVFEALLKAGHQSNNTHRACRS